MFPSPSVEGMVPGCCTLGSGVRVLGLVLTLAVAACGCYSSFSAGAGGDGGAGGAGGAGAGGDGGAAGPKGACTNPGDLAFLCSADNDLRRTLTACGHCSLFGLFCPMACDGNPVAPSTSVFVCAAATLAAPACDAGLSQTCLDCYIAVSACSTIHCSMPCTDDAAGCLCLDCVYDNCSAEFEACTGFGVPSSTTPGGPLACEAQPSCNPPDPT